MPEKCKQRERVLASGNSDIPSLPVMAIRGHLCFRCFGPPQHTKNLLRCGGCKRAVYCSKECQKLDWSTVHKKHCKLLAEVNKKEEEYYQKSRTWEQYRNYLLPAVRSVRDASPEENAYFVVQAQPYCSSCHRTYIQLSAPTRKIPLKSCSLCRLTFTCAECTPSHPDTVCLAYQSFIRVEAFRIQFFEDTGKASPATFTEKPRDTRKRLADAENGWYDYYADISDKEMVKDVITKDFSAISELAKEVSPAEEQEAQERMRMFLLMCTDTLTMPLTILSGLEQLHLDEKSELRIHLLGATGRELMALSSFEEIMHLVPGLKSVHVTAIGPHSWTDAAEKLDKRDGRYFPGREMSCCAECAQQGRKRSVASWKGVYHDFIHSAVYDEQKEKPDLIVAFNSGIVDGDDADTDWAPTIKVILNSRVPGLFTTYNEHELGNETSMWKKRGAKFLVEPKENRWRGLVPSPEFLDKEGDVWYQNWGWYVIQG